MDGRISMGILIFVLIDKYIGLKEKILKKFYRYKVIRTARSVGEGLKVGGPSEVNENTTLGKNVNFNGLIIRGDGKVEIGDNFHSGPDILLLTRNHNFDSGKKIPYDGTYIRKPIIIKENVWVGARVTILPGVTINEGAIIQAGSVVADDVPACGIAGGHPARTFRYRDEDHYYRLKEAGKFH